MNNLTASQKGKKIMHSFSHSLIKSINYRPLQGALDIIYSMKKEWVSDKEVNQQVFCDLLTTDNNY